MTLSGYVTGETFGFDDDRGCWWLAVVDDREWEVAQR